MKQIKDLDNANKHNKITEGAMSKQLLLFFFPILFGTFYQQLYNTADAAIAGRFVSKEAAAARSTSIFAWYRTAHDHHLPGSMCFTGDSDLTVTSILFFLSFLFDSAI